MEKKPGIDCVFVIPSNSKKSYQMKDTLFTLMKLYLCQQKN